MAPNRVNSCLGLHQPDRLLRVRAAQPVHNFGSTKCTNSCRTNDMPIAVIRKISGLAPRLRSGR